MIQSKPLSATQEQILAAAAQHPAGLAKAPPNLPAAARNSVLQSMLRAELSEEVPASDDSTSIVLQITAAGLQAIGGPAAAEPTGEAVDGGQEESEGQQASTAALGTQVSPVAPNGPNCRCTLRDAATALLVAWGAGVERSALPVSIEALRGALSHRGADRPVRAPSVPRRSREGTQNT